MENDLTIAILNYNPFDSLTEEPLGVSILPAVIPKAWTLRLANWIAH